MHEKEYELKKPNKDLYNVFKMQQDDMERILSEEETLIRKAEINNNKNKEFKLASDEKIKENKEWIESIGLSLDHIISNAHSKATEDSQKILSEIKNASHISNSHEIRYSDLVNIANKKGYSDTTIQDLLTKDEIENADQRLLDIENEFCLKTKLKKIDLVFLVTAVALQVVRQYVITPFSERDTADEGSKKNWKIDMVKMENYLVRSIMQQKKQ